MTFQLSTFAIFLLTERLIFSLVVYKNYIITVSLKNGKQLCSWWFQDYQRSLGTMLEMGILRPQPSPLQVVLTSLACDSNACCNLRATSLDSSWLLNTGIITLSCWVPGTLGLHIWLYFLPKMVFKIFKNWYHFGSSSIRMGSFGGQGPSRSLAVQVFSTWVERGRVGKRRSLKSNGVAGVG